MAQDRNQSGLMRWLGRQVGFVRSALLTDVSERAVYRKREIHEAPMPGEPQVMLRRTIIDEVVIEEKRE